MKSYTIQRIDTEPPLDSQAWDNPVWQQAQTLDIDQFHPTSQHRPRTQARLLCDDKGIYVLFRVEDQHVSCVYTNLHDPVCRDSCVEFFVEPVPGKGYLNFEINCGGTMLLYHIRDATRIPADGPLADYSRVSPELAGLVRIVPSMPKVVDPPIEGPTCWSLGFFAPFELFEAHVGPVPRNPGSTWRGNFYKCGTQKQHWAWWSPLDLEKFGLNFHQPGMFAPLTLG